MIASAGARLARVPLFFSAVRFQETLFALPFAYTGMVLAADCACRHGLLDEASVQRIRGLVSALGLPTAMPATIDPSAALAAMGMDKKVVDGRLRLVLPERIGAVRVTDQVEQAAVLATLEAG